MVCHKEKLQRLISQVETDKGMQWMLGAEVVVLHPTLKSSHYQKPTRQQMFFYTAGLKKLVISLLAVAKSHKVKCDHTKQKGGGCNSQQSSSKNHLQWALQGCVLTQWVCRQLCLPHTDVARTQEFIRCSLWEAGRHKVPDYKRKFSVLDKHIVCIIKLWSHTTVHSTGTKKMVKSSLDDEGFLPIMQQKSLCSQCKHQSLCYIPAVFNADFSQVEIFSQNPLQSQSRPCSVRVFTGCVVLSKISGIPL